jgi:D-threo-aldose 1-dehydrogenase
VSDAPAAGIRSRGIGWSDRTVTSVCVGTGPLGSVRDQYGYDVSEEEAVATILAVLDGPITFIDTANGYGRGASERRIGLAIERAGGLPDHVLLATKVDPLPGTIDFSGDRIRASIDESLERLGVDRLELVYLHDPEKISFEEGVARGGAVEALIGLRDEGVIGHLGVAGGPVDLLSRYLGTGEFEVVLSHNRFTLIDQSASVLMDDAAERGVAFINAAPYGGGILSRGPEESPNYRYRPADEPTLDRVRAIRSILERESIPLAAAALQFSLRDDRITSTIVGISSPDRVSQTTALAGWPISAEVWREVEAVAHRGRDGVGEG